MRYRVVFLEGAPPFLGNLGMSLDAAMVRFEDVRSESDPECTLKKPIAQRDVPLVQISHMDRVDQVGRIREHSVRHRVRTKTGMTFIAEVVAVNRHDVRVFHNVVPESDPAGTLTEITAERLVPIHNVLFIDSIGDPDDGE